MKLKDLQEAFDTTITDIDRNYPFPTGYRGVESEPNELGRGLFSRALSNKDDPHVVDKEQVNRYGMGNSSFLMDFFDVYAERIAEEKLWDMIHFPRVYEIKKYRDPLGEIRSKWRMERLFALSQLSAEELGRLSRRYFVPSVVEELSEENFYPSDFADQLSEMIVTGNWGLFRDKTLEKASEKLEEIFTDLRQDYGFNAIQMDLHEGNIMARRTQTGVQIVFSDPFVGNKREM